MGKEATIVINTTNHSRTRCQQRHYSDEEIRFVVDYGCKERRAGALMYFLREKDIPPEQRNTWSERLVNTAVLLDERTDTVLTVYRNREAFKAHRRKRKYRSQSLA